MAPRRAVRATLRALAALALALLAVVPAAATDLVIVGPPGSMSFGEFVYVLPNGNFVVIDPHWSNYKGAVYLSDPDGGLLSVLHGSVYGDVVGSGGIVVLANGNFVVRSPWWRNGAEVNAGAATWASGVSGVSGVVSAANSLVGTHAGDEVGGYVNDDGVIALSNGNYVVGSPDWDSGAVANAGAATWADGTTGIAGEISAANSLIGSNTNDHVGALTALPSGNYVVGSPDWRRGAIAAVGAVTFGNGSGGTTGVVSEFNSLVGSTAGDRIGGTDHGGVTVLANGNYVVASPSWDDGALVDVGAVTWVDGATAPSGAVSSVNSLVGTTPADGVGLGGVAALTNGNYVVSSPYWNDGATQDAGAVTWCHGAAGCAGPVTPLNSLIGASPGDKVGDGSVYALTNGNYVVASPHWTNGAGARAGAVTWLPGGASIASKVSIGNSLVGARTDDLVGSGASGDGIVTTRGVTALSNGNYVVCSPRWSSATKTDVGAATWASGSGTTAAAVGPGNSLTGDQDNDSVCSGHVLALANGNYVVASDQWHGTDAARTWGNGTTGTAGVASSANSMIGHSGKALGVIALANGNYVVSDPGWSGDLPNQGAVTWADGSSAVHGEFGAGNSLIGTHSGDGVGYLFALVDGSYVVYSPDYNGGEGALSLLRGDEPPAPDIGLHNSAFGGARFFDYDTARHRLLAGFTNNYVALFTLPGPNRLFDDGYE